MYKYYWVFYKRKRLNISMVKFWLRSIWLFYWWLKLYFCQNS